MNFDKAIEVLTSIHQHHYEYTDNDLESATQLGIEALKREKRTRKGTFSIPLPGETE